MVPQRRFRLFSPYLSECQERSVEEVGKALTLWLVVDAGGGSCPCLSGGDTGARHLRISNS